jgi:hypothetical protein
MQSQAGLYDNVWDDTLKQLLQPPPYTSDRFLTQQPWGEFIYKGNEKYGLAPVYTHFARYQSCVTFCLSTLTGIPYDEFPVYRTNIDLTWDLVGEKKFPTNAQMRGITHKYEYFLKRRGFRIKFHKTSIDKPAIGCLVLVTKNAAILAECHAVVMHDQKILFDCTPEHRIHTGAFFSLKAQGSVSVEKIKRRFSLASP